MRLHPCWLAVVGLAVAGRTLADAPAKITYDDHIRPIFREHCYGCHSQNKARNDLALDSYERVMKGGASGDAVKAGDPDDSYIYKVVAHLDEPKMPPNQEKIAAAKIELIKQWIAGGAVRNAGSAAAPAAKPKTNLAMVAGSGRPAGPPIMPVGFSKTPIVASVRPGACSALAAAPWAPLVAVSGPKQIALYHGDTGELLGILPFAEGYVSSLRFSRSGAILLAGGGHGARLGKAVAYDVKTGKRLFDVGDEIDAVLGADINESHTRVALGGPDRMVKVFSTADGSLVQQIKRHTDWVYDVQFSPDGVLLATCDRSAGTLVWEAESLNEYQNLEGNKAAVTAVAWRDDSNVLATACEDGTLRLWEMNDGKQIKNVAAHGGGALAVAFAHDGHMVSGGRDRLVKLWTPDARPVKQFGPMSDIVTKVAISHDGKRIWAGDWNGQVVAWDAASGKEVSRLTTSPPVK